MTRKTPARSMDESSQGQKRNYGYHCNLSKKSNQVKTNTAGSSSEQVVARVF
jgi:hypothetical protein